MAAVASKAAVKLIPGYGEAQVNVRNVIQRMNISPAPNTELVDITNGKKAVVAGAGDMLKIKGMCFPETIKARQFNFLDADTLDSPQSLDGGMQSL